MAIKDFKGMLDFSSLLADAALIKRGYKNMIANQEKLNQVFLSAEQKLKQKNNPNMLKTNSEEHLTYQLKQKIRQ